MRSIIWIIFVVVILIIVATGFFIFNNYSEESPIRDEESIVEEVSDGIYKIDIKNFNFHKVN